MTASAGLDGPLDILYLRNLYWPEDFGGNRYPFEVTTRLARRGHRLRVVTGMRRGEARPVTNEGVRISYFPVWRGHPLATHVSNSLTVIPHLLRACVRPPDVAFVSSYDVGLSFFTFPRRTPAAFIYHSNFYSDAVERMRRSRAPIRWLYAPLHAYMRFVERRVLGSAERIIAVSGFSCDEILKRLPGAVERVMVIPTGVDTAFFAPPPDRGLARMRLGLRSTDRVAIVVGRLVPVKRYDRAIEVIAWLRARGTDTVLLIVGRGPEGPALEECATRLGVADLVRFLGFRSGTGLREAFWAADLQFCTSEFENLSLALIEGMAAGVPVVALPTGGTVGLLTAIDPRLLAASVHPESLAAVALDLLIDPARREEAGHRCRAHVVSEHDWEHVVDKIEVLARALAGPRR